MKKILLTFSFCFSFVANSAPVTQEVLSEYVPTLEGYPHALVQLDAHVGPDAPEMTDAQKAAFANFHKDMLNSIKGSMGGLVKAFYMKSFSKDMVSSTTQELMKALQKPITNVEGALNDNPIYVTAYYIPWFPEDVTSGLLPVALVDASDENKIIEFELNAEPGLLALSKQLVAKKSDSPFNFLGIVIGLKLTKNKKEMILQILGQLRSNTEKFVKTNDQVHIKQLVIPTPKDVDKQAMSLLTIQEEIKKDIAPPRLKIEMGAFGGFDDGRGGFDVKFIIKDDKNEELFCREQSVPTLVGKIGPKAVDNKLAAWFAKDMAVKFRIFGFEVNPKTKAVENMDIRMEIGPLKCLSMKSINEQFANEGTEALREKLNELISKPEDLTDDLMDYLYE